MRPHRKSEAGAEGAGHDRSVCALFAFRARACGYGASGGACAGADEHSHAEWLATHGDLQNGLPREIRLTGSGLERDLVGREARQATGGPDPRSVGDAYRVDVRIVIWEAGDVLKVPTSALFRDGERWAVYVVSEDRARRTLVEAGRQTGREAEVQSGLPEGAQVIVHPGDLVRDGARVRELAPS